MKNNLMNFKNEELGLGVDEVDKVRIYKIPFFYFYSKVALSIEEYGYIDVSSDWKLDLNYLNELCNWSCFPNPSKPKELHSDIEYHGHDLIFKYRDTYYIDYVNGFFVEVKGEIEKLVKRLKSLEKVKSYKK